MAKANNLQQSMEINLLTGQTLPNMKLFFIEADGQVYADIYGSRKLLTTSEVVDLLNKLVTCGNGGFGCEYACGYHPMYGFVPEDGCPVHDREGENEAT